VQSYSVAVVCSGDILFTVRVTFNDANDAALRKEEESGEKTIVRNALRRVCKDTSFLTSANCVIKQ